MHSQLVVLGGGPGGYAAAFLAADRAMEVVLVDSEPRLGGTCLLHGCVPSKALLHVARVITEADELTEGWGVHFESPRIDIDALRARKDKLVTTLSGGLGQLARRRKVRIINARGTLEDSNTLRLDGVGDSELADSVVTFDHLILATGSVPASTAALSLGSPRVWNSTTALNLSHIPDSLLVVGGGYIGLELGSVYAALGSQVSVVELTGNLLPGVDRDLVRPLERRLDAAFGKRIYLDTRVTSLAETGDAVEVVFEGSGRSATQRYSQVLVSVGRRPASDALGLEKTRVTRDDRGFVITDANRQTADPSILAVGDVAGEPMLAHKATDDARIAVAALHGEPGPEGNPIIPAVVFTDPEIAWAGLTQEQAKAEGRPVAVAAYPWAASGRAHSLGRPEGLTKWLIDPDTDRLLGCGIVGQGAGELIGEAVVAINGQCTARDIAHSIHPHPTLGETLMNAADVHLGTAIEIYKPKR